LIHHFHWRTNGCEPPLVPQRLRCDLYGRQIRLKLTWKTAESPRVSRTVTVVEGGGEGAGGMGVVTVKRPLLEPGETETDPGL
jgi:hypothetical protein